MQVEFHICNHMRLYVYIWLHCNSVLVLCVMFAPQNTYVTAIILQFNTHSNFVPRSLPYFRLVMLRYTYCQLLLPRLVLSSTGRVMFHHSPTRLQALAAPLQLLTYLDTLSISFEHRRTLSFGNPLISRKLRLAQNKTRVLHSHLNRREATQIQTVCPSRIPSDWCIIV